MNTRKISLNRAVMIMVVLICVLTTLIQGTALSSAVSEKAILAVCALLFLSALIYLWHLRRRGKLTEDILVFAIIFAGMLLHCSYVLLTGLHDRQHDEGTFTGRGDTLVNPGHLGYIEYIYKFHRLPDINPYELFSYYHPPVHYVISALWVTLLTMFGMAEEAAFENIQALTLLYSGLFMLITYLILKKAGAKGRGLYAGLVLVVMHPGLMFVSGSVNNDMLSLVLLACCILFTLCFIRDRSLTNLILIALSIGVGMLCKLNSAAMAFPVGLIFLLDLIGVVRDGDRKVIGRRVKNYLLFGVVVSITGLAWIVRNLVKFGEMPGVPVPPVDSVMYTGDYSLWARLGVPAVSQWHFDFPFHPLSGDVIHNTWIIMLQTSLFGEIYPVETAGVPLLLCRIVYVAAAVFAVLSAVWLLYMQRRKFAGRSQTEKTDAVFIAGGYIFYLLGFAAFILKYPYTCSSDFRYVVVCLVYIAIGLGDGDRYCPDNAKAAAAFRIVRAGVWICMILTTIIYMIWQWDGTI